MQRSAPPTARRLSVALDVRVRLSGRIRLLICIPIRLQDFGNRHDGSSGADGQQRLRARAARGERAGSCSSPIISSFFQRRSGEDPSGYELTVVGLRIDAESGATGAWCGASWVVVGEAVAPLVLKRPRAGR